MNDTLLSKRLTLGVLGGMGPAATLDFLEKLVMLTPAEDDQSHLPMVISWKCWLPDRTDAYFKNPSQLVREIGKSLVQLTEWGADMIAIPCHSAHIWVDELSSYTHAPIISLVDVVLDLLRPLAGQKVGLIATGAVLSSRLYHSLIETVTENSVVTPTSSELDAYVMPSIRHAKRGDFVAGGSCLQLAIDALSQRGATSIVLACTELPLLARVITTESAIIDPTLALAMEALRRCNRIVVNSTLA